MKPVAGYLLWPYVAFLLYANCLNYFHLQNNGVTPPFFQPHGTAWRQYMWFLAPDFQTPNTSKGPVLAPCYSWHFRQAQLERDKSNCTTESHSLACREEHMYA